MYINRRLEEFTKSMREKKAAVLGIARSNTPLIRFLSKCGAKITAFDRLGASELRDRMQELRDCQVEYRLGPDYLSGLKGFDWVFRTPVIRPDMPELLAERDRGAAISSEMELFLDLCPSVTFGITGSDGKTTTTTLIYEMLKAHGYRCFLGGNIGTPLLPQVESMTHADIAVIELSSFQLLSMSKSVNVAVITNLSPNHLDVHKSYDEYIGAKKNIFLHQAPDDLCVLNFDNEQSRALCNEAPGRLGLFSRIRGDAFAGRDTHGTADTLAVTDSHGTADMLAVTDSHGLVNAFAGTDAHSATDALAGRDAYSAADALARKNAPGAVADFGADIARKPDIAAFVIGDNLCLREYPDGGIAQLIKLGDIRLPGSHNVENYLAAICAVSRYADKRDILQTAVNFNGVEHRIEHIRTLDGVRFYNDSIATSPTRTIACLNAFDRKVILIAGGKDKNLDFAPLGQCLADKTKLLILCGQTSELIKKSLNDYCLINEISCPVRILECDTYEDAVATAWDNAKTGDIVVLSPAGVSFDRFRDFEERGRVFKDLVNSLPGRGG